MYDAGAEAGANPGPVPFDQWFSSVAVQQTRVSAQYFLRP